MSILTGLGSSTGLIAGGVATVGAIVIAVAVVNGTGDGNKAPQVGDAPVQSSSPRIDVASTSQTEPVSVVIPSSDLTANTDQEPSVGQGASLLTDPVVEGSGVALGNSTDIKVASTNGGTSVVTSTGTGNDLNISTSPAVKPELSDVPIGIVAANPAKFDLVRVDKYGSAVVAGKATPGAAVEIYLNGEQIAGSVADNKGAFVVLFDVPLSEQPQVMTMATGENAEELRLSPDRVLVMGREVVIPTQTQPADAAPEQPADEVAPQIIIATDEGVRVMQPAAFGDAAPDAMVNVSLDLITYDDAGEVVLSGRGQAETHVRIYVDDKPVTTEPVDKNGDWQLSIPEVEAGTYVLRVDEIDEGGQVTSRLETPFQKEDPDAVKRVAAIDNLDTSSQQENLPKVQKITVQTGATLWALAQAEYGEGDLYMQIFNANRDTIRDPNLIYPGQIFEIPE